MRCPSTRSSPAVFILIGLLCMPGAAFSAEDAVTRANRLAYEALRKCFVTNGKAHSDMRSAGDDAKTAPEIE